MISIYEYTELLKTNQIPKKPKNPKQGPTISDVLNKCDKIVDEKDIKYVSDEESRRNL